MKTYEVIYKKIETEEYFQEYICALNMNETLYIFNYKYKKDYELTKVTLLGKPKPVDLSILIVELFDNLAKAFVDLNDTINSCYDDEFSELFNEKYPFHDTFEETTYDVEGWVNNFKRKYEDI